MKIGIIGLGFVGLSFGSVLASKGHLVIGVDIDKEKLKKIKNGVVPFYEPGLQSILKKSLKKDLKISSNISDLEKCGLIFVTVGTPQKRNGEIDLTMVKNVINKIGKLLSKTRHKPIIIIKSTVIPGTTQSVILPILQQISGKKTGKDFGLVTNPEFLRESATPNEDFENQDTIVIGTDNSEIFSSVKKMYQAVSVPHARYYHTATTEAEMIKCAQNTMLASRVALANMIYDACQNHGIEYDKIRQIAFDNFEILGPHMVQVPGPDGKRGFGGKCLPKDVRGFSTIHDSELLRKIIEYNDSLRDDLDKSLMNFKKS